MNFQDAPASGERKPKFWDTCAAAIIALLAIPYLHSPAAPAHPALNALLIAQTPPPEQTETPTEPQEETDEKENAPTFNPEQETPDSGFVIGDGDEMVMHENLVQIHGNALVKFGDITLRADHVWADFTENVNLIRASGNVHLITGDEETFSDELVFNLETKKGIARNGFTYSDPWYFGGSEIFKIEDKTSYVRSASLTTCSLKYPHYYFSVSRVIIRVNDELIAKNIILRIGGFPLFYFPAIRRDLQKGKIAKIIVKVGTDSYQGPYISIIQPVARKRRYDGALLYDRSARRGHGFGLETKYRFNDTQFQEIYIPIPPDLTAAQRSKLENKAKEIRERLEGKYNRYWLKQIFLPYEITDADFKRAKENAEELHNQLVQENADFAQFAQQHSSHETRYEGGDLGFITFGELIEDTEKSTPASKNTDKNTETPQTQSESEDAAQTDDDTPQSDDEPPQTDDDAPQSDDEPPQIDDDTPQSGSEDAVQPIGTPKLDPILEAAAFQLEEGQISQVLKTESAFHILKIERALDVYGEREIQVRRIDINIEPSDETRQKIRETANQIYQRAHEGEPLEKLAEEFDEAALSEINQGKGLPLNQMESGWQYSVRRLEKPGEIIQRRPVSAPEGLYIFQLIKKEETPSFEQLAQEFELEWETFQQEVMRSTEEEKQENAEKNQTAAAAEPLQSKSIAPQEKKKTEEKNGTPTQLDEQPDAESENTTQEENEEDEEDEEDEAEEQGVYRKHGFRGQWEDPRMVAAEARSLYTGEFSRVVKTKKAIRLIKVDRKRTYRGDFYFYGKDAYSFDRQNATRIGRTWISRWGHTQAIYTPWDNRQEGRRPINFTGRLEWRARNYKEELRLPGESTLKSFGLLNYGSAFTTWSTQDVDENNNLKFSMETIGDFAGRLEIRHIYDFTQQGTTSLQKLPQLSLNFSRMRFSQLPLFRTINSGLVYLSEKAQSDKPFLSLLSVPTLDNTSFDLDMEFGNFFRQIYKGKNEEERDVFLQTLDFGFDLRKQATLLITPLRELVTNINLNTNFIWHDRDQDKNRNIIRGVYSFNGSATNTLFRVYNISFIPRARKLRHEMQSSLRFDYQPPVDRNDNLYPFGPSTYFYERKRIVYNFNTNIEIKTQRSQSPHRIFHFDTRLTADFTKFDPLNRRKYEPIESDFTIIPLPNRSLNMTVRLTHDPNPHPEDGTMFKVVGIRSNIRYTRQKWNVSIGNSFSKRHTAIRASRSITANGRYRFNENLDFDFNLIFYPIDRDFYSQRISINRNLHDWNLRVSWSRIGIKRGPPPHNNVRQDFTFQISLIPEPAVSMGIGYDATTETWGLRTLPAGAPYNAFGVGNALGRSYF